MKNMRLLLNLLLTGFLVASCGRSLSALPAGGVVRNKIPMNVAGQKVQPGAKFALGDLWNLINTRLPKKVANFIVLAGENKQFFTDAQSNWSQGVQPVGSYSADRLGFSLDWIQQNKDQQVTLLDDPDLISLLEKENRVASTSQGDKYQKILLYFTIDMNGTSYRLYLNDPYPGKVVAIGNKTINPVKNVINAWDI
ncbi:hypothetical protein K2X40_03265 [Candidatus Babeliales bacterium]|nr:hypothetical protein [Candidatus Babeliales bacterium]